jgi:hypothetical protein
MALLCKSADVNFITIIPDGGSDKAIIATVDRTSDIRLMQTADASVVDFNRIVNSIKDLVPAISKAPSAQPGTLPEWYSYCISKRVVQLFKGSGVKGLGEFMQALVSSVQSFEIRPGPNMLVRGQLYRELTDLYSPSVWELFNVTTFGMHLVTDTYLRNNRHEKWLQMCYLIETLALCLPLGDRILYRKAVYPSVWTNRAVAALPSNRWFASKWRWFAYGLRYVRVDTDIDRPVHYFAEVDVIPDGYGTTLTDATPDILFCALASGLIVDAGSGPGAIRLGILG